MLGTGSKVLLKESHSAKDAKDCAKIDIPVITGTGFFEKLIAASTLYVKDKEHGRGYLFLKDCSQSFCEDLCDQDEAARQGLDPHRDPFSLRSSLCGVAWYW